MAVTDEKLAHTIVDKPVQRLNWQNGLHQHLKEVKQLQASPNVLVTMQLSITL